MLSEKGNALVFEKPRAWRLHITDRDVEFPSQ